MQPSAHPAPQRETPVPATRADEIRHGVRNGVLLSAGLGAIQLAGTMAEAVFERLSLHAGVMLLVGGIAFLAAGAIGGAVFGATKRWRRTAAGAALSGLVVMAAVAVIVLATATGELPTEWRWGIWAAWAVWVLVVAPAAAYAMWKKGELR